MPYGVLPYISGVSSIPGQEDLVNSLIAQLEGPQIPPPPTAPGRGPLWARILGPIGDALVAGGTIRRGGTPAAMGPYQSSVVRRGQDYRDALAAYNEQTGKQQASAADFRNRVRVGQFERDQELQNAEEMARLKANTPTPEDPLRVRTLDETIRHNKAMEGKQAQTAEPKPTIVYDKDGQAHWAFPPDAAHPGGTLVPAGFSKPPAQAQAGMPEALDNAEYLLDKMQGHFDTAVAKHSPFERTMMSQPAQSQYGVISGPAGYLDPDAAIHERNRHLVATALAAPLTGSRRGQAQIIQHIAAGLPSYSDNPVVADEFYKQMHAVIANLRRAYPSGIAKGEASDSVYLSELDDAISQARAQAQAAASGAPARQTPTPSASPVDDILKEYDAAHPKP